MLTIGVNLDGSHWSAAYTHDNSHYEIYREWGSCLIPCHVLLTAVEDQCKAGFEAFYMWESGSTDIVYDLFRLFGEHGSPENLEKPLTFEIVDKEVNKKVIQVKTQSGIRKVCSREEVLSILLKRIVTKIEFSSGTSVGTIGISLPPSFTGEESDLIITAAKMAGFRRERIKLFSAPLAATVAHQLIRSHQTILVCDFGVRFTASLVRSNRGKLKHLGTRSQTEVCGADLTRIIEEKIRQYIRRIFYKKVELNYSETKRLNFESQKLKYSGLHNLPCLVQFTKISESVPRVFSIDQQEFASWIEHIFPPSMDCVDKLLQANDLTESDIDHVVMTGPFATYPKVHDLVSDKFGAAKIIQKVNLVAASALGVCALALQAE